MGNPPTRMSGHLFVFGSHSHATEEQILDKSPVLTASKPFFKISNIAFQHVVLKPLPGPSTVTFFYFRAKETNPETKLA